MKKIIAYLLSFILSIVAAMSVKHFYGDSETTYLHIFSFMGSMLVIYPFFDFWIKFFDELITKNN